MKQFACGDLVPGCSATFAGASVEEVLGQVADHARDAHGMTSVPSDVVERVTGRPARRRRPGTPIGQPVHEAVDGHDALVVAAPVAAHDGIEAPIGLARHRTTRDVGRRLRQAREQRPPR